jgi:RNA polymerase, sigma-24 subunit, RpoE
VRAQQGDQQALTELIISQQHYVYSIAMSVLKNADDAADLTQEAFIRLFRTLPQYNGESRFTTWLYRLVINLCRDELRRRGRQVAIVPPATDDEELDALQTIADNDRLIDPAQSLDLSQLRIEVRRALEQLEPHYRLVLTLYYFEDLNTRTSPKSLISPSTQSRVIFGGGKNDWPNCSVQPNHRQLVLLSKRYAKLPTSKCSRSHHYACCRGGEGGDK